MRRCFLVSLHTSDWIRFCTILQDKLYSFNNQDHRSIGFLCKTNYGIDLQRFHEENSIMSGLFSKNNLLLCGMQSNNGISAKCWRISKITNTAFRFLLLTSAKFAVRGVDNEKNKGFTIWIHHLMVLLYAMFKTV